MQDICVVLIELREILKDLCIRMFNVEALECIEYKIAIILYKLETIYLLVILRCSGSLNCSFAS